MTIVSISPSKEQHDNAVDVYKRLLGYAKRYWVIFGLGIAATILYSLVDSSMIYLIKEALDEGFIARNKIFIGWLPGILAAIFILRGTSGYLSSICITWVGRTVVMDLRQRIFKHMLSLPADFFDNNTSGSLLSTIIYNVEQVAQASTDSLITLVREGFFITGSFIMMFLISWQLTSLFLLIAPLIYLVAKKSGKRLRGLSKNVQNIVGDMTHVAEESIEGFRVIRTFNSEAYEIEKFNRVAEQNRRREMKFTVTNALASPIVQALVGVIIILTVYLATTHLAMITAGGYVSIIVAMVAILKPMKSLSSVNTSIQKGIAAADSIFCLLDEQGESDQGTRQLDRAQGAIEFKQVSFVYPRTEKRVLQNISFAVEPGQTVAIVGRSGSGKSTLVNLLPRFYDINEGIISIDGINIYDLKLSDLRYQVSLVSQQVVLFNDTIAHNIAYGRLGKVSEAEIIRAAEAAHAMEFIRELPDGLYTEIGEKGIRLSGGQRQRIALARAILKDAPLLILDEATSALDTESERYIQEALEELMKSRTTLVIAHRLSTIENADKIIVMDEGKIVEAGTHSQLLALNKYYAKLHRLQFKDQETNSYENF